MSKISLIGDSIRMGYEPHVRELLGAHRVWGPADNGGDSMNLLEHFQEWFVSPQADIIHANCGLHDIRFHLDRGTHQVSAAEYEANLGELAGRLKRLEGTTVIWALCTPILEARHDATHDTVRRRLKDLELYNRIARTVMGNAGFLVHDLYEAVRELGAESVIAQDGVHMTEPGKKLVAQRVVAFLEPYLS